MRLKELVEKSKKTQKEIAADLGLSTASFNNYVNGRREMPYDVLRAIAMYFNVTTDYLLGTPPPKPDVEAYESTSIMFLPVYGMIRAGSPVLM